MGFIIRCHSNQDKAQYCNQLRKKGLTQMPTPFRTKGCPMNTICIFKDHFYTAHYEDIDGIMEGESMIEGTISQYMKFSLNEE
ncbi:MAG: hypothetical protein ACI4N3_01630 [Alphaproteobacteria bacterium]